MPKQQHVVKLSGVDHYGKPVRSDNCSLLESFVGSTPKHEDYFTVTHTEDGLSVLLDTPKGSYELHKEPNQNYYSGKIDGIAVHITLKKMVGKLIYWS